jgi:hypothetical protein
MKRKEHDEEEAKKKKKRKKSKPLKPITAPDFKKLDAALHGEKKKKKKKGTHKKIHQEIISRFHTLQKQLERTNEKQERLDIEQEMEQLGGLRLYQHMSLKGEKQHSNYNSSKWIIKQLLEFELRPPKGIKLKVLDVGALDFHYTQVWLFISHKTISGMDRLHRNRFKPTIQ